MSILDSGAKALSKAGNAIRNPFSKSVDNGLRGHDFPEGFRFEELMGPKELVVLAGNMMPKVPFTWGGSLRTKKDYYPGSSEPVTHILGSEEKDVTISGRLYDKRYSDPALYGAAFEMSQFIDELRKRGNVLRIWMGEWQRYGFLEDCKWEMKKLGDIDYELTFSIIGFNTPRNHQFLEEPTLVPVEINKALIEQATAFQETYSAIPADMPASIGDILDDAINEVASAVSAVTGFVDSVLSVAEDVVTSVNRAMGLVRYAQGQVARFQRRVGALSYNFTAATTAITGKPKRGISARYSGVRHISQAMSSANDLSVTLAALRARFAELAKTVPLARYRVIEGDTLQKVAYKFYQNADEWKRIYDHNKLVSTELERGFVLEIPRL